MRQAVRKILTSRLSTAEIARALSMSETTVRRYRTIANAAKYTWDDLSALDDREFVGRFNTPSRGPNQKRQPDYAEIHAELLRDKKATLVALHEVYREQGGDVLSYSQLAANLRRFKQRLPTSMRQRHEPGKVAFVDFSGDVPAYFDPITRREVKAQLFVGVLGCSNYVFAIATRTQELPDVIHAHTEMLRFFGGAPEVVVPDNMKTAVTTPRPNVKIQRTYADFANHYDITVLPARGYHPKDKAKVENHVRIVQRWILWRLNREKFYALEDLNKRLGELVEAANQKVMRHYRTTRHARYLALDLPSLRPLPATTYQYAEWKSETRVPSDYHVRVHDHFYSVPHSLIGEKAEARVTREHVELFIHGNGVAKHARSLAYGEHTTAPDHAPANHRSYAERNKTDLLAWAKAVGPNTSNVVAAQFARKNPLLGLPACDGIKRLAEQYGTKVFEKAAARAVQMKNRNALSVTSLKSILRNVLGAQPASAAPIPPMHRNIRGPAYYANHTLH